MKKSVILCIDDEKIVLNSLKTELRESFGDTHKIELTEDPQDAIDIFMDLINEGYEIPLIISDYIMPNMKGDELLRKFHELSPKTHKIMLTGQATTEGVTNAVNWARLYRYISKPWEAKDLSLTVREAIKSFYQQEQLEKQNLELRKMNEILEEKVKERTREIVEKNSILELQKNELDSQNKNITDSIKAARRIQLALLPSEETLKKYFPQHFVFYRPKDIVSGDFYWVKHFSFSSPGDTCNDQEFTIFAVADCTGHGVPGALMSMLGISLLHEIVNKITLEKICQIKASDILNELREKLVNSLNEASREETAEGMDIALCVYNNKTRFLQYAGAFNSLIVVREYASPHSYEELKADKMPVGLYPGEIREFTTKETQLGKGDYLYMYTDGFADQFGGPDKRKFLNKKFKHFISGISDKTMDEQKAFLDLTFDGWKDNLPQIDDVLVVGIKVT